MFTPEHWWDVATPLLAAERGFETREIADKLRLSAKTIETYKAHLKEKLGLASAAELARFAIEWARSEKA